MTHVACRARLKGSWPPERGFTLAETILVIGILAIAASVLMRMQPRIFSAQGAMRDEVVGIDIQRACAERLLALRRQNGYASVTRTSCNAGTGPGAFAGIGGYGDFATNPTVTLTNASNASVTACESSICTASITIAKTSGEAAPLPALVVRLTSY